MRWWCCCLPYPEWRVKCAGGFDSMLHKTLLWSNYKSENSFTRQQGRQTSTHSTWPSSIVMFFRAKECSQSFRRRSSVMVLRISISFLSCASVWTWVTHKLLVSSVMLLIWIWAVKHTVGKKKWDHLVASLLLKHNFFFFWPSAQMAL